MEPFISVLGTFLLIGIAVLLSENRKQIPWKFVLLGLTMQVAIGLVGLKWPTGVLFIEMIGGIASDILGMSDKGAEFVFGQNFREHYFAFKVLSTIIFFSAISHILFHWGILQRLISIIAIPVRKLLNVTPTESLVVVGNVFFGQTEAALLIQPYIASMKRSGIMVMLTGGMATISGSLLAAFVGLGVSASHLILASVMSAPAALVIARIMVPEANAKTGAKDTNPKVSESIDLNHGMTFENTFDAACKGASDGVKLAISIAAMIIAFVSLIALANYILEHLSSIFGMKLTVQQIIGYAFAPIALSIGVPWEECIDVGFLLGEKMILNEFVAYVHLGEFIKAGALSERSITICTYALCGFANFASIAIQVGGIGELVPEVRNKLASLGFKAMIAGTLAALMTASLAGALI